jgi:cyclopropane fatty-acyl-phospholipid synthase-like methyltransferase
VAQVVREFIYPYVGDDTVVCEIGVGGGRLAARVAPRVRKLVGVDVSRSMLKKARVALAPHSNIELHLLEKPALPAEWKQQFDFVYAFDVFVHFDLHMMWTYLQEIRRVLKKGGRAFLHTSNLQSPAGWDSFAQQESYSVVRHFFVSPDMVDTLVSRCSMRFVKRSKVDESNFYLHRDYLFVIEK